MSARLLVLGRSGQVGHELAAALGPLGSVHATGRGEVDFLSPESIERAVNTHSPEVIVNAVAYTAVDKAESDSRTAEQINAGAVETIARAALQVGACVIHYSTDYVFDGAKTAPWEESDPTGPLGVYGSTKLRGEQILERSGVPYLVLRTSWIYGTRGANFVRTILRAARSREELSIVSDQVGAPTWSRFVAATTAAILARNPENMVDHVRRHSGVYHVSAGGQTSWYGFALALLAQDPKRAEQTVKAVKAIPTSGYPTPARRPANSVLSNEKLRRTFGLAQTPWEEQLRLAMESESFL